ncbi:MAG: ATP-binding cassette domain-containing protein [Suipraeoptans sp.]
MLKLENINTGYGKKQILHNIWLEVKKGDIILLVGSNGSGKTTLFKTIYRQLRLWKDKNDKHGRIIFDNVDITNLSSHELIKKDLLYIPQKNELFDSMNVFQNLELCLYHQKLEKKEIQRKIDSAYEDLPMLKEIQKQSVINLSGGERKLLSWGMVLVNTPKMLLYDEPLSGLCQTNEKIALDMIRKLKEKKITTILIEHRIKDLLDISSQRVGLSLGCRHTGDLNSIDDIKRFIV